MAEEEIGIRKKERKRQKEKKERKRQKEKKERKNL